MNFWASNRSSVILAKNLGDETISFVVFLKQILNCTGFNFSDTDCVANQDPHYRSHAVTYICFFIFRPRIITSTKASSMIYNIPAMAFCTLMALTVSDVSLSAAFPPMAGNSSDTRRSSNLFRLSSLSDHFVIGSVNLWFVTWFDLCAVERRIARTMRSESATALVVVGREMRLWRDFDLISRESLK